ncbi:ubiquitin-conjugating enzyme E2-34 kDa [Trichomonascus vanleenenianus]|uniref:SCF E2 ubiquitin-protein ligase catalytic subunit CDC34 n=1 Tax=Trichomonascus vanleenenianus TaxID=2268995 RepID=UPI003ECB193C
MSKAPSATLLFKQFKELTDPKKAIPSFHITLDNDDIYQWNIGVMVLSDDSPYHGGYFKAKMTFPKDYPYSPPKFRFTPAIYHPNVYQDGLLCISILHRSGDESSGEADEETWSPVQSVESVLISIVSLLSSPNINSPANVDAAVDWRKDRERYDRIVREQVEESKKSIPEGFVMPSEASAYVAPKAVEAADVVDDDFWMESEESEGDFDDDEDEELHSD